ncbi:MAG: hypothetical protein R6U94_14550, partial [Nitriliruptoraceae bacterium]
SRADYRQSIECYIAPRIGGIRLEQLTPEHLDRLYRALEADGKRRGACRTDGRSCPVDGCAPDLHDGLSAKSVRNVHGCLHVALEAAVARGYLPRNVADLANPPKARRARSRNARDHWWTRHQLVAFLDHSRTSGDRWTPTDRAPDPQEPGVTTPTGVTMVSPTQKRPRGSARAFRRI